MAAWNFSHETSSLCASEEQQGRWPGAASRRAARPDARVLLVARAAARLHCQKRCANHSVTFTNFMPGAAELLLLAGEHARVCRRRSFSRWRPRRPREHRQRDHNDARAAWPHRAQTSCDTGTPGTSPRNERARSLVSELKGMSWSTASAFPGITRSSGSPHDSVEPVRRRAPGPNASTREAHAQ